MKSLKQLQLTREVIGNGPEPFVSNRYSMESSSSVVTVYPTRLLRPLIQMLRDKLEESRGLYSNRREPQLLEEPFKVLLHEVVVGQQVSERTIGGMMVLALCPDRSVASGLLPTVKLGRRKWACVNECSRPVRLSVISWRSLRCISQYLI